jgi:hypothetical protein
MPGTTDHLTSWHDTGTRRSIVEFVERVTTAGCDYYLPPAGARRVAA